MVIVELQGGLGNQMFQYAAAKALAIRLKTKLKLDISNYENDQLREYALNNLSLKADFASVKEVLKFKKEGNFILSRRKYKILEETPPLNLCDEFFRIRNNVYLRGYWQSEQYFSEIDHTIRNEFRFKEEIRNTYSKEINKTNSVSIHFRRGDYVTNEITNSFHGICSHEYYIDSIEYITSQSESPYFFIFSDDLDWCRNNITDLFKNYDFRLVENTNDIDNLNMMSMCKHNILANSSFSWWAAWLNQNDMKLVVAPQNWIKLDSYWAKKWKIKTDYIVPNRWKRI